MSPVSVYLFQCLFYLFAYADGVALRHEDNAVESVGQEHYRQVVTAGEAAAEDVVAHLSALVYAEAHGGGQAGKLVAHLFKT